MKKLIKKYYGLILFYLVIAVMIPIMNTRFTELNTQKNSTDFQPEIAETSTRK